ncbi:sterile alpha motif domain-containing protein 9-like [Archocentrus centrarchus]|uniref:sterile alpha motif domain-containing protein 9-like n=1 Tax=Archocentrus centrarchus TaxID=63155 RepID=UPI0011E9BF2E|nr:sterile alpha motif domain-containing protein 9-like [Archocentrus centrarchus]XP_030590743.1 sterile alpha motif domain-containing protein 9-like [Archocentrus centrarchus]
MDSSSSEMDWCELSYGSWAESHVSSWLRSIGIKEMYIIKMMEEEVTGPVLTTLHRDFLSNTIGMKSGQIEHLLKKRDELLIAEQQKLKKKSDLSGKSRDGKKETATIVGQEPKRSTQELCDGAKHETNPTESSDNISSTEVVFCDYRKFAQDEKNFRYVKHNVLPPETGTGNMIVPCHEYKSLEIAHKLDSKRLQVKVASEVLRFACACMNMRANGTIHFGVMDKVKGNHKHGEIIGIPVNNQEDFVDALDYIERCFKGSTQQSDARSCIRNPRFIEVLDRESTEKTWVIEYDVVPKASIVKDKLYYVGVPKFFEKDNKVKCEEKIPYSRVGANTPRIPEDDLVPFIQGLREKDQQREEAESSSNETGVDFGEDQKRKLTILLTCGKKHMDNSLFYIVVTNKFQPAHLDSICFLVHMNLFCVFDFDPDSKTSGLCGRYKEQKAVNLHFLDDYANDNRLERADIKKSLDLCERTSWIFCNGRHDFPGGAQPCDEKTWIKTQKRKLKKAVSLICNDILPGRSFVVLFLLMSDVENPLVETFHEFYAEMSGHEFLAVVSESKENYKKWSSLAQVSCPIPDLKEISIVEMPLSHVDATVQSIQLLKNQSTRTLPVLNGGLCFIKSVEEAMLDSLEIVSVDQCDDTKLDIMSEEEIQQTESYFYRGGKINWINFCLADKHKCGVIIERDAYKEANTILDNIVHRTKAIRPIESVNIYHHPGSGGSTVARQILWRWRNKVRCAVVKQGKEITTVCEHAVKLREHDENNKNSCLPVLLLLEDHNPDYINDLRGHLGNVIATKKIIPSVLCFILIICNRSNDPESMCRASISQTVAVTHKLSNEEKPLFSKKLEQLKLKFEPDFILTFVLMTEGYERSYIKDFVKNLIDKIDHSSSITRLIRFVALLNCYVKESYISVSHCEASLGIATYMDRTRYHAFVDHLSEEARLIFIHLNQSSTHIPSIRIIHSLVAEEILSQLSANLPQSDIAMNLIDDTVLINHRFDRDEFLKFIRALFIRRNKKSRGDPKDTTFSPLIEHVCTAEKVGVQKAVDLMKAAYIALGKDAYVAQQLARLLYTNLRFEEALKWAEEAKYLAPQDTFILDTLGQVYKWWFYHLYDTLEEKEPSPESCTEIISTALKGISAFRASEKTPKKEAVNLNNSYYGEVDVGCRLLKFLSGVNVFSNTTGKSELMQYLLRDYIPAEVKTPWQRFHQQLKGLQKSLSQALECISEELSYFQTDISEEDEELDARDREQVHNPREWLTRKSAVYAEFFCVTLDESDQTAESSSTDVAGPVEKLSPFQRQMRTYKLGGGNVTSILSLLYDKKPERAGKKLETIFSLYPDNLMWNDLDPTELTNFIFCQIALNCIRPGSSKLLSLQKLQELSKRFITKGKHMSSASALFLLSLLFWPETSEDISSDGAQILSSAIDALQKLCEQKTQHRSQRKSRIVTHFFLAKAKGLNKIVHRSAIEKEIKGTLSERKLKWLGGEVWKTKQVVQLLKRVEGWTENEKLFVKCGSRGSKIKVVPRYSASLPHGNEKVNFYLGFSFDGVVACDIQVMD